MEHIQTDSNPGVRVRSFGAPQVVNGTAPEKCEDDEVCVELLGSPVNPADRLEIAGSYSGTRLPFTPGAEGAGRVVACGPGARQIKTGDLVLHLTRGNWQRFRRVRESDVLRLPSTLDAMQASMLRVNPATASLLLTDVLALKAGDSVAFNAANSSVGRLLATLGSSMGLRMLAIVRGENRADLSHAHGVREVLVDDEHLAARLRDLTRGAGVRLALDCVAGPASAKLAEGLADGGTLCVYGHLSGEACYVPSRRLTFGQIQVQGFNLGHALARRNRAELTAFYEGLAHRVSQGELHTPIAAIYPLARMEEALAHAENASGAKVLLSPDGAHYAGTP